MTHSVPRFSSPVRRLFTSIFLKRGLLLFLSFSWFLSMGSLAHASPVKQQALSSKCPTIPANFDFAHASKQQLHQYLLPARPTGNKQSMAVWQKSVTSIKQTGVCVPDTHTHLVYNSGRPVQSHPAALANCPNTAPGGTSCYYNWNGYVAGSGSQPGFNDVYGNWNVQCISGSNSPSDSLESSWVGLGGFFSGENLWQAGSGWSSSSGYYLWYEAVGSHGTSAEVYITGTHCGDHIFTEVWFAPNNPSSNVGYVIIDTSATNASTSYTYRGFAPSGFSSGNRSGEWIDERPSCGKDQYGNVLLYKLTDYNYSDWSNAYISPNNASAGYSSIGSFAHTRVWMENNDGSDTRIAWTNGLGSERGSGTDNYNTYWEANGSSQCG